MKRIDCGEGGVTLVELIVTMFVVLTVSLGFLSLYSALLHSSVVAKRLAVGLTLATNQMEYLKSLPYDDLAVAGGSIIAPSYIPATTTKTVDNLKYTIVTSIYYVDDAYDNCGSYPSVALMLEYCRGSTSSTPMTDQNPQDYKIADVAVTDSTGQKLADIDTEFSAKVAETGSTTGALFITVDDASGSPIANAQVEVTNNSVTPAVDVSRTTDSNGIAVFYGLPPDSSPDYVVSASKSGYSSLNTIAANGSLQPTYSNLTILTQQSSSETLVLNQMTTPSLLVQATDTSGNPLSGLKVYIKGGYKKYTASTDTTYYYDNMSAGDNRPTTDSGGLIGVNNLAPGPYYFCGDSGSTSCTVGTTTYYLAAAVPYSGSTSLSPVTVPTYDPSNPPSTTYSYNSSNYIQKVQLMLTTSQTFPRVSGLAPSVANLSSGNISNFPFSITGVNLPCSSTASSCSTTVKVVQGSTTVTASCTGDSTGLNLSCTANLSSLSSGGSQLVISNSGGSLTLPAAPELGGISIEP